jgi:hypothetical protein
MASLWIARRLMAGVMVAAATGCASATRLNENEMAQPTSSHGILAADRLHKMVGVTAFDALRTMPSFFGLTTRQPGPRFLLIVDGLRTSNFDLLKNIQAADVVEIRVVDDSQSIDTSGQTQIVVTTIAKRNTPGCSFEPGEC